MSFTSRAIVGAIERVTTGAEPALVEVIWKSQDHWPVPRYFTLPENRPLHVSVLDSSFNPPTLAHLALACAPFPARFTPPTDKLDSATASDRAYDAHLLLLSVRNADKSLKAGDATFVQRAEMMILLAKAMVSGVGGSPTGLSNPLALTNVAVGVMSEPTFVGKSSKLLTFLNREIVDNRIPDTDKLLKGADSKDSHPARLTFVVGYDTLVRIFSPKFYPSADTMQQALRNLLHSTEKGGENSSIVWSRRASGLGVTEASSPDKENQFLQQDGIWPHVESGALRMIDIGEEEKLISSSQVRMHVSAGDGAGSWQRMCPPAVVEYLQEHSLYSFQK